MSETWKQYMERMTSTLGYVKIPPVSPAKKKKETG